MPSLNLRCVKLEKALEKPQVEQFNPVLSLCTQ